MEQLLFTVIGILVFVFGLLFIIAPATLKAISEWTNKVVADLEARAFTYRLGVGLFLMIAGLLFFFVAWYIKIRG